MKNHLNITLVQIRNPETDTLENILAYHPNFHKQDIHVFDNFDDTRIDSDLTKLSKNDKNEVTYGNILTLLDDAHAAEIPKRVYENNPDVKLMLVACDPIRRSYLDFANVLS